MGRAQHAARCAGQLGPMMLGVLALHGLHRVSDEEDLSWWHTGVRGWGHMLGLSNTASRAEFWGFLAHCVVVGTGTYLPTATRPMGR